MNVGVLDAFKRDMTERGLVPPADIIADGRIHRCDTAGRNGRDDGSYLLHLDQQPAGGFQNWQDGRGWQSWTYRDGVIRLTQAERAAFDAKIEVSRRLADEERQRRANEARLQAGTLLLRARPADPGHPYLAAKGIKPHGVLQDGDDLLVPMRDVHTRQLVNMQRILPDGSKRFLAGGAVSGAYFGIGELNGVLQISEGFSTAASLIEATGYASAASFGKENLKAVTVGLRQRFSDARMVICADNDVDQGGQHAAREAAEIVGAVVAVPPASPSEKIDFNDLFRRDGASAVKSVIDGELARFDAEPGSFEPIEDSRAADDGHAKDAPRTVGADEVTQQADAAEVARLAALDRFAYSRQRKAAAGRLGIGVGALDMAVREYQAGMAGAEGCAFMSDVEPWPDPVNGAQLLDDLASILSKHVGLPPGAANAVALWIVHAHAIGAATVTPLLAITSPTPECGKSTLVALVGKLTPNPLLASNITSAAVFRAIERWQPTLLVDEADTFVRGNDELRGVLNSGHSRDTAFVVRTVGDDHEPRRFSTWSAKVIALIGDLPATLASRAIHITLRRLQVGEKVEPLRLDKAEYLRPLTSRAARWATDNLPALKAADPAVPDGFANRRADNWRPLLAIADAVGFGWPERARQAALALDRPDAGDTVAIMLLTDIYDLFRERGQDRLTSADIVAYLGNLDGRPWPEFGRHRKPISANQVARLLKPFCIFPSTFRVGGATPKGYAEADFADAFARYLNREPQHRNNR